MPDRTMPSAVTLACAFLVAATLAAWLTFNNLANGAASSTQDRAAALAAAQNRVPLLLSYSYANLRSDLARAEEQATGRFSTDFTKLASAVITPVAEQKKITTKATVVGAGVVTSNDSTVEVLAFVNQSTITSTSSQSVNVAQVLVVMQHVGGTWKISRLTPG